MNIGALYIQKTLPLMRRVLFPYSVLAERGHPFSLVQVPSLLAGLAYDYDVTVLPQWEFRDEDVTALADVAAQGKVLAYDLTDPGLLENEQVRAALPLFRLVSVPNEYLKKEVRLLLRKEGRTRVEILPSVTNPHFFAGARRRTGNFTIAPGTVVLGAFGPHAWSLLVGPLKEFCTRHPHTVILTEPWIAEGPLAALSRFCHPVSYGVEDYPWLLLQCHVGLCPLEGDLGQETIWAHEYGTLCKPVIASAEGPYRRETPHVELVSNSVSHSWLHKMEDLAGNPALCSLLGVSAFKAANAQRATAHAKSYQRVLAQLLPQSLLMR